MAWFHCQFCDFLRELSDDHVGKPAKCPSCKKRGIVAARDGELQTIGRLVEDQEDDQNIGASPGVSELNTFANPKIHSHMSIQFNCPCCTVTIQVPGNTAGKYGTCPRCGTKVVVPLPENAPLPPSVVNSMFIHAEAASFSETDETNPAEDIEDWQNDPDTCSVPPPRSQKTTNDSAAGFKSRESVLDRVKKWADQGNTGRVFETYQTIRYLRWSWIICRVLISVVWGIGTLIIALNGLDLCWKFAVYESAKTSAVHFVFVFGFGLLGLVIVLGLFTLLCLSQIFMIRVGLETVAVFFDMAHDLRRLADTMPRAESTPDNC